MPAKGKIACLLGPDFEDSEFRVPHDRWTEEGYEVEVIGAEAGKELRGKKGKEIVRVDRSIDQARPDQYVALFIPGGHSPDHLRADPRFVNFVRSFEAAGRLIAAVCHGPQLLLTAGLVQGRTLTAWVTVQGDLASAGANVRDEPVVRDRNWITSRKPDDLPAFSEALIQALEEQRRGLEVRGAGPA